MAPAAKTPQNYLLSSMPQADFALLAPRLEAVALKLHQPIEDANRPIKHIYFPERGIISVVARGTRSREIEVGIIGREGVTGLPVIMGGDRSPHAVYVQLAGHGVRLLASDLRDAMETSATLQNYLLRFAQAFMVQTAHTALANGQAKVEERLARWILMAHDRADGDEISLTHEFLALMLSVRRPGVTVALQLLMSRALIRTERGRIVILDRAGLRKTANGLYGTPEDEYRRLTGWKCKA